MLVCIALARTPIYYLYGELGVGQVLLADTLAGTLTGTGE